MSDSRQHDPAHSPDPADPRVREHRDEDEEAQQHPEGNAPDRIGEPRVGLPVESGDLGDRLDDGDGANEEGVSK